MGPGSDEVDEIRQQIDESRENLGAAVGALAYKVVGAASGHAGIVKASCVEGAGGARF